MQQTLFETMAEWKECKDNMSREAFAEQYVLRNNGNPIETAKKAEEVWDSVCFCVPKRCHGDFLLKTANEVE